jgi:hypothetical protein
MFSSENMSSYAWSFCHFFSCLSFATRVSSFFYMSMSVKVSMNIQ